MKPRKLMYYVDGVLMVKNKEVTEIRAVICTSLDNLKEICDKDFVRWNMRDERSGPFTLSENW